MKRLAGKLCICGKVGGVAGVLAWVLVTHHSVATGDFWITAALLSLFLIVVLEILFLAVIGIRAPLLPLTIALTVVATVLLVLVVLHYFPLLGSLPILGFLIGILAGEILCRFLSLGFGRYVSSV